MNYALKKAKDTSAEIYNNKDRDICLNYPWNNWKKYLQFLKKPQQKKVLLFFPS